MRWQPTVVVTLGAVAATGAWGVRELIQRGRAHQDPGFRQLTEAVADVKAGRRTTPVFGEPTPAGEVTVTFLARAEGGQAPRVVSDVTGWGEHLDGTFDFAAGTMAAVGETEWFFLRAPVVANARIEYRIAYGQTDYRFDPHNPRRSAGPTFGGAEASEFVTPGYTPPEEFEGPRPSPAGSVSEAALEGPCRTLVYTPPGPAETDGLPVAVFLDLRTDPISRVLDWLIGHGRIPPVVAAFVGPHKRGDEACSTEGVRPFVAGPLLQWLRTTHGVSGRAEDHAVLAVSYVAKDALEIAVDEPDAFTRVGLLIPGRRITRPDLEAIPRRSGRPLRVAILAGRYDRSNLPTAQGLHQALAAAGHRVDYLEVPEGHSAVTWRNHLRAVLVRLFGAPARTTSEERGAHAR